jgi:hypothetical protein
MRTRQEIQHSMESDIKYGTATDRIKRATELSLEVLLDIRDLLSQLFEPTTIISQGETDTFVKEMEQINKQARMEMDYRFRNEC